MKKSNLINYLYHTSETAWTLFTIANEEVFLKHQDNYRLNQYIDIHLKLQELNETEQAVLNSFYKQNKAVDTIADELQLSIYEIKEVHKIALKRLQKKLRGI